MKTVCKYSGVTLIRDNTLDSLGMKRSKMLKLDTHPIFSAPLGDILLMASSRPEEKLSAKQRHLLAVAMIYKLGTVKIKFPITTEILTTAKVSILWPTLVESMIRIGTHSKQWDDLKTAIPRMEVRADNYHEIDIVNYIKEQIYSNTSLLLFTSSKPKKREEELLEDEIELERQLKEQLHKNREDRKKYIFKPHMGKYVLNLLDRELRPITVRGLEQETRDIAMHIFTSTPEKVKVTSKQIRELRNKIVEVCPVSIAAEDSMDRAYISLTVGYLDALLDYFADINSIFGGITVKEKANLPSTYPADYTVSVYRPEPFKQELSMEPKNPNRDKSTNPLLQKILAKRKAEGKS